MQLTEALGWFYLSMKGIKSDQTITWYQRRLTSLTTSLDDPELETINLNQLRQWRSNLVDQTARWINHPSRPSVPGKLSPVTIHGYIRAVNRFFTWCLDEGYLEADPSRRLEKPPLPTLKRRGIPAKDRDKMLAAAKGNPRDLAILSFLCGTACRVAGCAGLLLTDLDLENQRATVREKGRGGNNKIRTVYLGKKATIALEAWLLIRPAITDSHVFIGLKRGGKKKGWHSLTTSGIYQILKRLAEQAGVELSYNPHAFRHGSIRGMLNNGAPLSSVSQIAGHSSTKVTGDIYGTLNDDELQSAHDRYSWF